MTAIPENRGTLLAQIADMEFRIVRGRIGVRSQAILLEHKLRRRLTAPTTLLFAAALGFGGGKLSARPLEQRAEASGERNSRESGGGILNGLVKALTLINGLRFLVPMVKTDLKTPDKTPSQTAGKSWSSESSTADINGAAIS